MAHRLDERCHQLPTLGAVGGAVGGDHALVDAPGGLNPDVAIDTELRGEPLALAVCEQVDVGVQGPSRPVERVVPASAVAVQVLLDSAPAPVQGVPGQAHDMEGVHDRGRGP